MAETTKKKPLIILGITLLILVIVTVILIVVLTEDDNGNSGSAVAKAVLPDGFSIATFIDPDSDINGLQDLKKDGIKFAQPRTIRTAVYNGSTIIYVGSSSSNMPYVFAIIDYDSDGSADQIFAIFKSDSGDGPHGIAIDPTNYYIYINAVTKTYICECNVHETVLSFDTSRTDETLPNCREWIETPTYTWHGRNYMAFNPKPRTNPYNGETYHELCLSYSAECNACDHDYPQQTIICFPNLESDLTTNQNSRIYEFNSSAVSIDNYEKYGFQVAAGIRSVVGLSFHPLTNDLWFTDNGRDKLGNNFPDDKLNVIKSWNVNADGNSDEYPIHFGFPYCHCQGTGDPYLRDIHSTLFLADDEYYTDGICNVSTYQPCIQPMGPHVAALGLLFYNLNYTFGETNIEQSNLFPSEYYNSIFIAHRGSWNRDDKIGYRVVNIKLGCENSDYSTVVDFEVFVDGWVDVKKDKYYARPADVALLPDGSLLVSDDTSEYALFRVTYNLNNDSDSDSSSVFDFNDTDLCNSDYMTDVDTVFS